MKVANETKNQEPKKKRMIEQKEVMDRSKGRSKDGSPGVRVWVKTGEDPFEGKRWRWIVCVGVSWVDGTIKKNSMIPRCPKWNKRPSGLITEQQWPVI